MLVLSRMIGQKIVIDEQITIEVLRVRGNQIRLGITAPVEVKIRRAELTPKPTFNINPLNTGNTTHAPE